MTGSERLSLAGLVAALAAGFPLASLTVDRSYLLLAFGLMIASFAAGALLRRIGAPNSLVRLGRLAPALFVPWLVPEAFDPVLLYTDTVAFIQIAAAPMPYKVGFALFTAVLLWLLYLLTDALAVGMGSPGWTFPVLVLPYLISAVAIYAETSPFLFFFTAAGYALILATAMRNSVLISDGQRAAGARGWRTGVVVAAAGATAIALTGAVLVSLPIPERSRDWSITNGSGAVLLGDPSLDLIRNINSPSDQPIITYTTTEPGGLSLRLAALPVFDSRGFHLTATDLLPLPLPDEGQAPDGSQLVRGSVKVGNFASEYLPVPWIPTGVEVAGDWRYDPKNRAVVAVGDNRARATRDLSYQVTGVRLPALSRLLARREAGDPGDGGLTLDLPDGIAPEASRLAESVTANSRSDGEKAIALRDYLSSGAFRYSTTAAPGTTMATLNDFLLGGRTGYCEQFAGALATLARMQGIPSRVAVGFLPGQREDDKWEVSPRNMHAWTELYFDGLGWVPLDATPAGAVGLQPDASASPSASVSSITPSAPELSITPTVAPANSDGGADPLPGSLPWLTGGLAVAGLLAGGPQLARWIRRWRRLAGSAPHRAAEDAWAVVRDAVRDRGEDWPAGSSRQVAALLGPELDATGRAELEALALQVERARYAADPAPASDLSARVLIIETAIEKRWAMPTAWLRLWWPRSLWP